MHTSASTYLCTCDPELERPMVALTACFAMPTSARSRIRGPATLPSMLETRGGGPVESQSFRKGSPSCEQRKLEGRSATWSSLALQIPRECWLADFGRAWLPRAVFQPRPVSNVLLSRTMVHKTTTPRQHLSLTRFSSLSGVPVCKGIGVLHGILRQSSRVSIFRCCRKQWLK